MIGSWALHIPHVKKQLELNDAQLGFALFCLALGLLFFLPVTPYLIRKIGLGKCTIIGICLFSLLFIQPVFVNDYYWLCTALFFVGICSGFTDVAMNTLVSEMEKTDQVNFMSAAHGFFSLGGAAGALVGMLLISVFELPVYHMICMALFVIISNILLSKYYVTATETKEIKETQKEKISIKLLRPLIVLGFLAMVVMGNEGAVEHWSAIYLTEVVNVSSKNLVGLGFVVFSVTMTIGRFFGDGISAKIGSVKVIVIGCILAVVGYIFILTESFISSIVGFGIIGLGLSVNIPELLRLSGKTKGVSASKGISFVSGVGFLGFLLGPIILGYLSDSFNLKISFTFLLILLITAALISGFVLRRK